jgi:hypothetical protein
VRDGRVMIMLARDIAFAREATHRAASMDVGAIVEEANSISGPYLSQGERIHQISAAL